MNANLKVKNVPKWANRARGPLGELRALKDNKDGTFDADGTGSLKGMRYCNLKVEDYYFFEFN